MRSAENFPFRGKFSEVYLHLMCCDWFSIKKPLAFPYCACVLAEYFSPQRIFRLVEIGLKGAYTLQKIFHGTEKNRTAHAVRGKLSVP